MNYINKMTRQRNFHKNAVVRTYKIKLLVWNTTLLIPNVMRIMVSVPLAYYKIHCHILKNRLLLALLFLLTSVPIFATTYTFSGTGNWTDAANWSPSYPGLNINSGNEAVIAGAAICDIPGSNTVAIEGTLTNNGILNNNSLAALNIYFGLLANNGTLNSSGAMYNSNGTMVNNSGGAMNINAGCTLSNSGTLTNNAGGTLTNNGQLINSTTMINNGTLDNNGTLYSTSNLTNNGTLNNNSGASLVNQASNGTMINNGTLNNNAGGSVSNSSYSIINNTSGIVNNSGNMTCLPGSGLVNNGNLNNNVDGTLSVSNGSALANDGTLTNIGILNIDQAGLFDNTEIGSILNNTSSGIVNNSGGLENAGTLSNNGTLKNNGTLTNTGTYANNGIYQGVGTFTGSLFTNPAGGTVAPGNSPGCLTFTAGLTNNGSLDMEISGITPCSGFDRLNVNGTMTHGGTLNVNFGSYIPVVGQTFQIINANTYSGTFASIVVIPSGIVVSYANGILQVTTILPVDLTDFKAIALHDAVQLNWHTASENNNEGFYIERSVNASQWQTLGFAAGQGTTTQAYDYTFLDEKPLPGKSYYRLRQRDFDGNEVYSNMVNVNLKNLDDLSNLRVFPNPVYDGELTLYFPENLEEIITISLFGSDGQQVKSAILGAGIQTLDISGLVPGIYTLQALSSNSRFFEKITVQK